MKKWLVALAWTALALDLGTRYYTPIAAQVVNPGTFSRLTVGPAGELRIDEDTADIQIATVSIADAAIKTLPSTPVELIATPGAGFRLVFLGATIQTDVAAAYTNVDTDGFLWIGHNAAQSASTYVPNDSGASIAELTALTANTDRHVMLNPYTNATVNWGNYSDVNTVASVENQPLEISVDNDGSGNFTGGNAANEWTVDVYYVVRPVP
jgi:hypothetical protein